MRLTNLENKNNNNEKISKIQQPISKFKIVFLYLFFKLFYFYIAKNIHNGVFKRQKII